MIKPRGQTDLTFKPSAASAMCSGMSFSISLFYPNVFISNSILKNCLSLMIQESPVIAGKITRNSKMFLPKFADYIIEYKKAHGCMTLRYQSKRDVFIGRIIDQIWENNKPSTLYDTLKQNHRLEPIKPSKKSELVKVDLIRCEDGSILTLHMSHILADAGRAFKFLQKMGDIYARLQKGEGYIPQELAYDTWFQRAWNSATSNMDDMSMSTPSARLRLQPSHILSLPKAIKKHMTSKYVSVFFYVSHTSVESLQSRIENDCLRQHRPSKLDIVQALNISLISSVRKNRLVPEPGENVIINADLSKVYNPGNVNDTLGNSSDFLEIGGSLFQANKQSQGDRIIKALATNALTIRNHIHDLYSNPLCNVRSKIQKQYDMSNSPKPLVLAAYLVHGNREKLASCSAIASFPVQNVRRIPCSNVYPRVEPFSNSMTEVMNIHADSVPWQVA